MLSDERIIEIMNDAYGFGPDGIEDALSDLTAGDMDAVQSMNGIRACIRAALAEAAQSPAVPVVERNQCDGCNRGLQVCDDGLHREPSGHPVMACTRNKYTRSIPATELERLRKEAERYQWLRMQGAQSDKVDKVHYFGPKLDEAIDAAIAKERQS